MANIMKVEKIGIQWITLSSHRTTSHFTALLTIRGLPICHVISDILTKSLDTFLLNIRIFCDVVTFDK